MRYGRLALVSVVVVTLILAGCTMLDLFGKSPTQLAQDLLGIVFTASATQLVYIPSNDATTSTLDLANGVAQFVRGFLRFSDTATPTKIEVIDVVEYTNYKFYQVSGAPNFVDKVYMINLALTYPATKVATELPMITIKNVPNKAYFFTVYLQGATPTVYPTLPLGLID
ncbi:hypothetical protein [Pseudothermotoga sp.]